MTELLCERESAIRRALADTLLRLDVLEAQTAQAREELQQLTGALMELNHLRKATDPATQ